MKNGLHLMQTVFTNNKRDSLRRRMARLAPGRRGRPRIRMETEADKDMALDS